MLPPPTHSLPALVNNLEPGENRGDPVEAKFKSDDASSSSSASSQSSSSSVSNHSDLDPDSEIEEAFEESDSDVQRHQAD